MKNLSFKKHFKYRNATMFRNENYSLLVRGGSAIKIYNENKPIEKLEEEFALQKRLHYKNQSKHIPRPDSITSLVDDYGRIVDGIKMDWDKNLRPLHQLDSWISKNKRPKIVQIIKNSGVCKGNYNPSIDDIFVKNNFLIPNKKNIVYCGLENVLSLEK